MTDRSSTKRSRHHLKYLIEAVIAEEFNLSVRGLSFMVDDVDVSGSPPKRLRVWATLHFLRLGSPFCCMESGCHVPLFAEPLDRVNDAIRRRMRLRHEVSVEVVTITPAIHDGVEFRKPIDS